ncbi:MAG: FAD-binding oxidoreductase [Pseudomonadota bacterium]
MSLKSIDGDFEAQLRDLLPAPAFRDVDPRYLEEPRGRWKGRAGLVIAPGSVTEVSHVVRHAAENGVPVIPYGGGTGLVGGQVAPGGDEGMPAPILLSLERMTAIRGIWPEENVLIAEAGAILSDIHDAAASHNRLFPLSIAAKGSARIGGNLATNAGGVNVLRYGNARDLCLGLEAVLPDGRVFQGLKRLRKDNTGYDLRHLLIGSEGTLGVITAAALKLAPVPAGQGTALMVVPSPQAALSLLSLARDQFGEAISACELMHKTGLDFLAETLPDLRLPFLQSPEWFVLLDIGLPSGLDPQAALEALYIRAAEQGIVTDGLIAQSQSQRDDFWSVRETIPEANRRIGAIASHDVSLPLSEIARFIEKGHQIVQSMGPFRINCFGHLGDGNLHYNVFPPLGVKREAHSHDRAAISEAVHELVHELGGSVSAEHGVGRLKVAELERFADPAKLAAMRAIKTALDPKGIMNPGAVLREQKPTV